MCIRSVDGKRWIITAWEPCLRVWANAPVPCLRSDPKFPDCAPRETKRLHGWLSFYEGTDVEGEFRRIEMAGWRGPVIFPSIEVKSVPFYSEIPCLLV